MTWASSITMGSCPECCGSPATCIGCTGQTTYPPSYNVTFTITDPGTWDASAITGCSVPITWGGSTPNDGNCLYDITSTCSGSTTHPLLIFDLSWFNGKTFTAVTSGTDLFDGSSFDYKGCIYLAQAECTQDVNNNDGSFFGTFKTQLALYINIISPGNISYNIGMGGLISTTNATWSRGTTGVVTWGCSGSSLTSASGSFVMNTLGPGGFDYSSASVQRGGTIAGSFVVTP